MARETGVQSQVDSKMALDASLLNTQGYKYVSRVSEVIQGKE